MKVRPHHDGSGRKRPWVLVDATGHRLKERSRYETKEAAEKAAKTPFKTRNGRVNTEDAIAMMKRLERAARQGVPSSSSNHHPVNETPTKAMKQAFEGS